MEKFRNLADNIFFKIFLIFLGLSFVVWGVNGFIMNSPMSFIAKIDGKKISYNEFLRVEQNNRERIYRSNPNEKVMEYLNSKQFKSDTLNNILVEKLIDLISGHYGIYPDKDLILKDILTQPNFKDEKGNFNRIAFINYLKINNLTEEQFVTEVSRQVANQIIITSLIYNPIKNERIAREVYSYRKQKREADVIVISFKDIKSPQNTNEKELAEFFKENQEQYLLPEFRKISYIEFSKKDIAPQTEVSEAEIAAYYNENAAYLKPANRDFYHVVFEDQKIADKFLKELEDETKKSGKEKAFLDLALKFQKRQKADILLDGVTNNDLLPEIAKDAFALKIGDNSKVLKSPLGFHIFYLVKENPQSRFELTPKIKAEIKERLSASKQEDFFNKKIEEIDDNILTQNSLKKVADELHLKIQTLDKFNQLGFTQNKENITGKVKLDDFVKNSFEVAKNSTSELIYSKSTDKYYALYVDTIEPARHMTLSEVKAQLTPLLIEKKKQEQLTKLAGEIYKKLQVKDANYNQIAKDNNLKIIKNKVFQRSYDVEVDNKEISYANNFVIDLFSVSPGAMTIPHAVAINEIHIGIVKKIIKADVVLEDLKKVEEELAKEYKNQILERYDNYLQHRFKVEINEKMLNNNEEAAK